MVRLIEYAESSAEVRVVYDDIMRTRGTDWINNFWKALANDPSILRRTCSAGLRACRHSYRNASAGSTIVAMRLGYQPQASVRR